MRCLLGLLANPRVKNKLLERFPWGASQSQEYKAKTKIRNQVKKGTKRLTGRTQREKQVRRQ